MKKKKIGVIAVLLAIVLVVTIILIPVSPVKLTKIKADSFTQSYPENAGDSYHKVSRDSYDLVCSSGLIEMYLNKSTATVGILDTSSNTFWSTLPQSSEQKSLGYSALEVVLSNGNATEYVLNSQDSSVAFGNFTCETAKNGVTVKYSLALDKETGAKEIASLNDGAIRADVSVSYTLLDGSFYASVSMNNISLPKGVFLEKIRLLNSFGAYSDTSVDDFIFVPDGSGALIKTGLEDKDFTPVSLKVYGDDPGVSQGKSPALLGAFGIKHGTGAFLCIIENGESIANINAYRNSETSINSVGTEFAITDTTITSGKSKQTKTLGNQYSGEMKLCYRFLSGKSATYAGMAAACRENLIRNSVISTKTVDVQSASLPLIVNLQFGYNQNGKIVAKSTFEQAQALMALLKAKGVNTVYLRANGLFSCNGNGGSGEFGKYQKVLGTKDEFGELYSYLSTQNFPLYIDTDVLSFDRSMASGAKSMGGKKMKFTASTSQNEQYLPLEKLEDTIELLLTNSADVSFDGYALNDMGTQLYSDYSMDFYPRESSKKEIAAYIPVLASYKPVMIDGGNFYSIKNANVISSLPSSTVSRKSSNAYYAIPFVELILHGTYDYSIENINLSDDMVASFLRSIEYGALPSAYWYCANTTSDDKYGYDNNINDIVTYTVKANEILGDLRDARMTSHYEIQNGVICTEYNNSTKVYINYTENDVTINGIVIGAKDCVKIS